MILVLTHSCVDITVAIFNDFIPIRNSVTANFEACICFFQVSFLPDKVGWINCWSNRYSFTRHDCCDAIN